MSNGGHELVRKSSRRDGFWSRLSESVSVRERGRARKKERALCVQGTSWRAGVRIERCATAVGAFPRGFHGGGIVVRRGG